MRKHRNIALELICVVQFWGVDLLLFLGCQMVPKQSPPHLGFQVPMVFCRHLANRQQTASGMVSTKRVSMNKNHACLGHIRDEILPNYEGII